MVARFDALRLFIFVLILWTVFYFVTEYTDVAVFVWGRVHQGRKDVRWRQGQETSLASPCSNVWSYGANELLKKVLLTLLRLFGDPSESTLPEWFGPLGNCALLALPRFVPGVHAVTHSSFTWPEPGLDSMSYSGCSFVPSVTCFLRS